MSVRAGLTGTAALVRLGLRRDRILGPVWVLVFVLMAASSAGATKGVYPDLASRVSAAAAVNKTAATRALYGPIWDVNSLAQLSLFKFNALGAALVAVLSLILVTRHTRGEEEEGRLELLGAGVVGRHASLGAALVVTWVTVATLAALTWFALVAAGLPAVGSLVFALTWLMSGTVFAGVAAVTAQLTSAARAANGLAAAVLGLAYLLRAVGDASGTGGQHWLSWLSPIGWAQQVKAYSDNRWPVLLIGFAVAGLLVVAAFALVARRDLGAGLFAERAGRPRATAWLAGPFALALRLQRGVLLAWTAAFVVLGLVMGSLASSAGDFLDSQAARDMIRKLGGQQVLTDAFFSTEFGVIAIVTSVFVVQSVLRLRSEEAGRRAEPLLATAITRPRWLTSHVGVAALGAIWLLLVAGFVGGSSYAVAVGDGGQVLRLTGAALVQLPAVLVLGGFTLAAYGFSPRLAVAGWAALVLCLLLGELGPLFDVDPRVMDLSPYTHVPRLPGGAFSATPLVWLALVAAALIATGYAAFRRRDLS